MQPIVLHEHQDEGVQLTDQAWKTFLNILLVLPTGAGKTFVMAWFAKRCKQSGEVCLIFAHRNFLLGQLSESLCKMGVHHTFIAAKKSINIITNENKLKYGDSFYEELSTVFIVSVDTFLNKLDDPYMQEFFLRVRYWMMDEGHHPLAENKWGQCVEPLVNAKGLGVTATAIRADKKGLGAHAHGIYNHMIVGATQGDLMEKGLLSLYKIYIPPTKLDVKGLRVTNSGDWNQRELAKRSDKADITGDAVDHYIKYVNGLPAITFCVNIAHSDHVAAEFNARGIPSVSLSSKTSTVVLNKALKDFMAGVYLNLVNCDLFGEGFDVPKVVAVIMLRKTESYSLFKQQFGRCLRVSEGKNYGVLIDHVGNVQRHCVHGAPHDDPTWTLDADTRSNDDGKQREGRVCPECFNYYTPKSANQFVCPDCLHEETKEETNDSEQKFQHESGELVELEIDFITNLMSERLKVDMPMEIFSAKFNGASNVVKHSAVNNHAKRQHAQTMLRIEIQRWCTNAAEQLWDKKTVQGKFEIQFGINIFKAQVLSEKKALELTGTIRQLNHEVNHTEYKL